MRSKLFVPGIRPELFAKAAASDADAISFDLEDSVPAARKDDARRAVADCLRSLASRVSRQRVIVRVNAPDTADFEADLRAVVQDGLAIVNLPKTDSARAILAAIDALERAEAANGVSRPIAILANIETPAALGRAAEIAAAHPRVMGLQLGLGDLFEPLGIDRRDTANVHAAMFAVRMAAGSAGVLAIDGAFADLQDTAGFRAEAAMSRGLGYSGKSCIHPSQIATANAVFMPNAAEVAMARRIVDAAGRALARDHGAFVVDGRMIDGPFLKRAEAIVAAAGRDA